MTESSFDIGLIQSYSFERNTSVFHEGMRMSSTYAGVDSSGPALWPVRYRWVVAIAFAFVPVFFTAAASAASQVLQADDATAALTIAGGAAMSAALGVIVMKVSPANLRQFGFRAPQGGRAVLWFLPLLITIVLVLATQGLKVAGFVLVAYAVLTLCVAVNEEVWFRGIILAVLRGAGVRVAIIGSSVMFAVLHLANLAGGQTIPEAILQVVFAALFGVAAAELTVLTGSLWPAILWHAVWDFANYIGGNTTSSAALVGIGIACAVILAYVLVMWRAANHLPS